MKLGVAGYLPEWDVIDHAAARRVREAGLRGASIFFPRPLETDTQKVRELKHVLDDAGLEAAQANGWYEVLVHPQEAQRAEGVRGVMALCRLGRILSTDSVYVRPGSLNPNGAWYPHPDNHSAQTFERLVHSLKEACQAAEEEGVILALEGHVLSPLDTPQRMRDVLDAVGLPALKVNLDPVNFIGTVREAHNPRPVLEALFDLLSADTIAAHLKDLVLRDALVIHVDEVVPGTGTLDYSHLLEQLQERCPSIYCLIEHLPDEMVPQARDHILSIAKSLNIEFEA